MNASLCFASLQKEKANLRKEKMMKSNHPPNQLHLLHQQREFIQKSQQYAADPTNIGDGHVGGKQQLPRFVQLRMRGCQKETMGATAQQHVNPQQDQQKKSSHIITPKPSHAVSSIRGVTAVEKETKHPQRLQNVEVNTADPSSKGETKVHHHHAGKQLPSCPDMSSHKPSTKTSFEEKEGERRKKQANPDHHDDVEHLMKGKHHNQVEKREKVNGDRALHSQSKEEMIKKDDLIDVDSIPLPNPNQHTILDFGKIKEGETAVEGEGGEILQECRFCNRQFRMTADRFAKHEKACAENRMKKKVVQKPSYLKMMTGGENSSLTMDRPTSSSGASKKPSKWKSQSAQLRFAMQSTKQTSSVENVEAPPPEDFRVLCEHCGRKFDEEVGKRHIPHCRERSLRNR